MVQLKFTVHVCKFRLPGICHFAYVYQQYTACYLLYHTAPQCSWNSSHRSSVHFPFSPVIIWNSIHRQIEIPNAYTMNPGLAHTVSFPIYRIHTYFRDVQIFAVFVNESETAKINTRKNLSWHCYATCIRQTAISSTPKDIKNIVTLILMRAATQNVR